MIVQTTRVLSLLMMLVSSVCVLGQSVTNVRTGQTFTTIASAITASQDYDTLRLSAHTFTERAIAVNKFLTFIGVDSSQTIVQSAISLDSASGVVFQGSDTARFTRMKIRYAKNSSALNSFPLLELYECAVCETDASFGGVSFSAKIIAKKCRFYKNKAAFGGVFYSSNLAVDSCLFFNNEASFGAAIANTGTLSVRNSVFDLHPAGIYGAVWNSPSSRASLFENCRFANQAGGAAITADRCSKHDMTLRNCAFANNNYGVVLTQCDTILTQIENCIFSENTVGFYGLSNLARSKTLVINSLFFKNTVGISSSLGDSIRLVHCTISGNQTGIDNNRWIRLYNSAVVFNSLLNIAGSGVAVLDSSFSANPSAYPFFSPNNLRPAAHASRFNANGATAFNDGTPIPTTDLEGNPRPLSQALRPTVGAYEQRRVGNSFVVSANAATGGLSQTFAPVGVALALSGIQPANALFTLAFHDSSRADSLPTAYDFPFFYSIGTSATAFTGTATFDWTNLSGTLPASSNAVRIFRREGFGKAWQEVVVSSRGAKSVSFSVASGGEFAIGTDGELGVDIHPKKISDFALFQNYPNPFNPTTTIRYALPTTSVVRLELFDVLGRQIATLVDSRQSAGAHHVNVSASTFNLASGLYVYRLQAGSFVESKKMLLMN